MQGYQTRAHFNLKVALVWSRRNKLCLVKVLFLLLRVLAFLAVGVDISSESGLN